MAGISLADPAMFFVHDTLIMGESPEAFTAMITTHTTFTKSPKGHFTGREMDNSVVDTATTELALRGDLTSSHFITGKKVQSKRMRIELILPINSSK